MSSMLKPPKPVSRRQELREDAVVTTYARAITLAEEHRTALIAAGVGIVVLFLGVLGYFYWQAGQEDRADELLGAVLPLYERGDYELALDGTPEDLGLLDVADDYGSTDAGNLAHFYAASALYELGRYDEAAEHFDAFDGEGILGASALAGRAAIHELAGEHAEAGRLYERAAASFESEATAPEYYLDAGRNYEAAGDYAAARRAYEAVAEAYPDAPSADLIPIFTARLDALADAEAN